MPSLVRRASRATRYGTSATPERYPTWRWVPRGEEAYSRTTIWFSLSPDLCVAPFLGAIYEDFSNDCRPFGFGFVGL